jgi:plastocyanin
MIFHPWRMLAMITAVATIGIGCNDTLQTNSRETTPTGDHAKPPIEGARIIGIVFRLVGEGMEPPANGGVVYLEDAPKEAGEMTANVEFDHKTFTPFIAVVPVGGSVTFANKDALPHHVFSPDLKDWDTGILKNGETATRRFDSPGMVSLLCNIHPEMLGYVAVLPSSSFGRIGTDGRYVIPNVHAGTYRATAWAPRLPTVTQSVTVGATGVVTLNFHLPPPANTH